MTPIISVEHDTVVNHHRVLGSPCVRVGRQRRPDGYEVACTVYGLRSDGSWWGDTCTWSNLMPPSLSPRRILLHRLNR